MASILSIAPAALGDTKPGFLERGEEKNAHFNLSGHWTISLAHESEVAAAALLKQGRAKQSVVIDLAGIDSIDTAGAWLIDGARQKLQNEGVEVAFAGADDTQNLLLREARFRAFPSGERPNKLSVVRFLEDIGVSVYEAWRDLRGGVEFLGRVSFTLIALFYQPQRFRFTSLVFHLETFGLRSVPIVALITFLVGGIVAQQGIFQLSRFGASTFAVDLIGLLVLRELAVLLTSIMIAGRSGSAITAELGSMKMREEIDALEVMGLDSVEVLIVPRILALLIAMPLLTFVADMSALFGGLLVSWSYAGINPEVFLARLQAAITINTLTVGLIKAPFMALVIGLIAAVEGLAVQGSAESLGRQVTASVVKAIFMVIVVDGLFAMFFAAIRY